MADAQPTIGQDDMEEMLSIGEAADVIGVSVDTLRRWSKKERVTTYRSPGGHRYYKKKDLIELFDAKYTRDVPTERSSQDQEDQESKIKTQEASQESTDQPVPQIQPQRQQPTQTEDVTIPQMQPVRVVSNVTDHRNYPVPDLMTPAPPEPINIPTQTQTHTEVQTVTVDRTETTAPTQYFRQPAAPIQKPDASDTEANQSYNAVISDHTQPQTQPVSSTPPSPHKYQPSFGLADRKEFFDTSQEETEKEEIVTEQPQQEPEVRSESIKEEKIEEKEAVPVTTADGSILLRDVEEIKQESMEKDEEPQEKKVEERSVDRDKKETATPKQQKQSRNTEKSAQKEVQEDEEEDTDIKLTATKDGFIMPQEEEIKTKPRKKADVRPQENKKETKTSKDTQSVKTDETKPREKIERKEDTKKDQDITEQEAVKRIKEQQEKKSILEPEGIDASKLNSIEKVEDEGWLTKNKSNILIGFTVFLLIDIILFVIWLTTSRILSPIP